MMDSGVLQSIYDRILEGDAEGVSAAMKQALDAGEAPLRLLNTVLNPALKEVGERFDKGKAYLPELILSAEAMEVAVDLMRPHLAARQEEITSAGRVVMATVQGDIHDIGKNIVCALLRANGFEVHDLGRDVAAAQIVSKAEAVQADIIGLSALLSTTLPYCNDVVRLLEERGLRDKYRVYVGGGAATPEYAEQIGAEYGGPHAEAAVATMQRALGRR